MIREPVLLTKSELVARLTELEARWPKGLWLFATGNGLHLMRQHPDGTRHTPIHGACGGGMDPALIEESFNIPNDGGDW